MYTPRGTKKHLFDIQQSIRSIVTYTQNMDESLSRQPEIRDYQRIIGFRNILAHGYDAIDQHLVWDAVKNHLTPLSEDVERLMSS